MESLYEQLARRLAESMAQMGWEADPLVRVAQDESHGDYQSNCAMGLARKLKRSPRDVATAIVERLRIDDMCEQPEIAGPGFINFRIKPSYLARLLEAIPPRPEQEEDRLGIAPAATPKTVVMDLSSPNLAKEMHVGHLRSTVIGDCIARVLQFLGHTVHRENHVGDWGTQFGMLVAHLRSVRPDVRDHPDELAIADLESFYVEAKARFDADDAFKQESRKTVVALQQGDPTTRRIWKAFCNESLRHCHANYDRLGVELVDRGESYYADRMDEIVARLEALMTQRDDGFVAVSQGALCLFMKGFQTRKGDPLPMIVRKSDGGYNYATSDLATLVHRVEELGADHIIYVVGLPQKQHFEMLFEAVRQAGWVGPNVVLQHLAFGNMLNKNGQPFKTREGGTVKLKDLLDEAVNRARNVLEQAELEQKKPDRSLAKDQIDRIAERVGVAAVKYFDLSHALASDYRFDFDSMLAMEGNTAVYMMYAYARIRSIARKAGAESMARSSDAAIRLDHPSEIMLAKNLVRFAETLDVLGRELRPNVLTDYLYKLAKSFSRFYDRKLGVRVLDAPSERARYSRLRLCDLTARVLKRGLGLLGIETVERM